MDYQAGYQAWLSMFADDAEVVKELLSLLGNEKEIEDRFYTGLSFGTAGMRGVIGYGDNRMNRYNVRRATKGFADYLLTLPGAAERGVVIAYDSRKFSPEFAKETALVLAATGVKAFLFPQLEPVPVLSFAVRYLQAIGGVVITASHNPPQYNGYKVYWEDGAQLPPERADEVQTRMRALDFSACVPMDEADARDRGLLVDVPGSVVDAYIEAVKALALRPELLKKDGASLKIVYTPLHGSGNIPVRRVLTEMGVTNLLVVPEQEKPDPAFPTVRVPNPEEADTFTLAIALANREGADACFATDPDCDRLGVATRKPDGTFQLFNGNQIGCLLLYYILESHTEAGTLPANAACVKSLVSTEMARAIADHYGVTMIDTLTGFKFIAEQIESFEDSGAHTFLFGFEESYGYLSSTCVRDKDAVNASLLVTELSLYLKQKGQTLLDLLETLYRQYGYFVERTINVSLPGKDGLSKSAKLMQALHDTPPTTLGGFAVHAVRDYKTGLRTANGMQIPMGMPLSDVLYYELSDGAWVCVRPSGTEPKIKLYVNTRAKTLEEATVQADRLEADARARLA